VKYLVRFDVRKEGDPDKVHHAALRAPDQLDAITRASRIMHQQGIDNFPNDATLTVTVTPGELRPKS